MSRCSLPASTLSDRRVSAHEMRLGGAGFEFAEDLLFADQLPRRAGIFRHEHGGGGARVADQPLDHLPDFVAVRVGEGDARA